VKRTFSAFLATAILLLTTAQAHAAGSAPGNQSTNDDSLTVTGKRVRIVAKSALYGFGGGLVVGLASQVFKKKAKNILLFGSLGLYAGIFLGIYVITTSSGPAPYEGPDTYDDFSLNQRLKAPDLMASREELRTSKADLKVNLLSLDF